MSWYYGTPGSYQSSPYEAYPGSGPSVSSYGRANYTQASSFASTSAIPYSPPHPPPSQNSAPPVESASFYRPPSPKIHSSAHLNRPAHIQPITTPLIPPPPPSPRFPDHDAFIALFPPTYAPPPPAPPDTVKNEAVRSRSEEQHQIGDDGKKETKRDKGKKKEGETIDDIAGPTKLELKSSRTRCVARKDCSLKTFTSSIFVLGAHERIISIRQLKPRADMIKRGWRALNSEELKSLHDFARAARRNSRSRYKTAQRNASRNQKISCVERDEEMESKEEREAERFTIESQPTTDTDTSNATTGRAASVDVTESRKAPQYLSLLDYAQEAILEIVKNEEEAKRTDSRPRNHAQPLRTESRPGGSNGQVTVSPLVSTPLRQSSLSPLTVPTNPSSTSADSDETKHDFESSSVPDSTVSSAPPAPSSSTTQSNVTPICHPSPNLKPLPQGPIFPIVQRLASRSPSLVPSAVAGGMDFEPSIIRGVLAATEETLEGRASKEAMVPTAQSILRHDIASTSSSARHARSQTPLELASETSKSVRLTRKVHLGAFFARWNGWIAQLPHLSGPVDEQPESTAPKEGGCETSRDETCELEAKKEMTTLGDDLGGNKEEEDMIPVKEETQPLPQQSNPLAKFASPPLVPRAALDSLKSELQVVDASYDEDGSRTTRSRDVGNEGEVRIIVREAPSSDLSEVDEGIIAEDDSDDSGCDSISEVLAKRQAQKDSSASMTDKKRPKKTAVTLLDYLNESLEEEDVYTLRWADPSVSPSVKSFVYERGKIFRRQRVFAIPEKQHQALRIAITAEGIKESTLRNYLGPFASYLNFCTIAKIPAFPITSAIITLFLYQYRVNWPELSRSLHPTALRSFARRTTHLFDQYPKELEELGSWPNSGDVMRELQNPVTLKPASRNNQLVSVLPTIRKTRTASRTNSPAIQSKPSPAPPKAAQTQPKSKHCLFDIVVPERIDPRRAERPSNSRMFIDSSISFTSPKAALDSHLRNIPIPEIGDRFKSLRAVKMSIAVAVVYSQGYAIATTSNSTSASLHCQGPGTQEKGCSFRIHATLDSNSMEWTIDEVSNEHTHQPSQELQDVEWRTPTMDIDLIEGMYQVDRRGQLDEGLRRIATTKRSTEVSQDEERINKRIRTLSPRLSERLTSEQFFLTQSPIPPPSSVEPSHLVTAPSPFLNKKPLLPKTVSPPAPSTSFAPKRESPTAFLPPQALVDDPFYTKPEVPEETESTALVLDLSTTPAPQLVFFLKSLDPSLEPLAPLLQACGYSTLDSLIELAAIGSDTRKRMYREIVIRGGKVEPRLFELLECKLVEASENDYRE